MTALLSAITGLFLAALTTVSLGQTSEDYAAMGQKLWASFECGALAEYAGKIEESRTLYKMGYDQGTTLLDAFRAGKIDEQTRRKLPLPVLFMLDGGPTIDFILGRIFESAMQDTFGASSGKDSTPRYGRRLLRCGISHLLRPLWVKT
jgi:hypothetical protein